MKADRVQWDPSTAWRRYCGFLDVSTDTFMGIQSHLLQEQVDLVADSRLGRRLMRRTRPRSIDEFRETVPLTTYGDYLPFLDPDKPQGLPDAEYTWVHTTGARAGHKWVPYTRRGYHRLLDSIMAGFILAGARSEGDVVIRPGDVVMYNMPPRPYLSGMTTFGMIERFGLKGVLEPENAEGMEFKEKVRAGFESALSTRVDVIISMTSVLVRTGEAFETPGNSGNGGRRERRLNLIALGRLLRAKFKSVMFRRPIRPRDLWPTKALICWGIDTAYYRERVREYWGRSPYEMYACTEGGVMGMQTRERGGLVFTPYSNFYEFIPEAEARGRLNDQRQPRTLLLSEVEPGETYEVVITNFYGMPLMRYRVGHMVRFQEEPAGGWKHGPEFAYIGRGDDRIDISGFTRIDEKTVWDALREADLQFDDWVIRKEMSNARPRLHLYAETRTEVDLEDATRRLHRTLTGVDQFYRDLESMLDVGPMLVTVVPSGTFDRYYTEKLETGEALERRRPARMNADDDEIADLLRLAREGQEGT